MRPTPHGGSIPEPLLHAVRQALVRALKSIALEIVLTEPFKRFGPIGRLYNCIQVLYLQLELALTHHTRGLIIKSSHLTHLTGYRSRTACTRC